MLLPQTAEYALRAVIHVARHQHEAGAGSVRVNEMAAALGIPQNYLSKTCHQLARAGILASTRGPAGGFRLAVAADAITMTRVIALFHDTGEARCLLANRPCGEDPNCPVHHRWKPVAAAMHGFFGQTTIADLVTDPERAAAAHAMVGGASLDSASLDGASFAGAAAPAAPPTGRAEDAAGAAAPPLH